MLVQGHRRKCSGGQAVGWLLFALAAYLPVGYAFFKSLVLSEGVSILEIFGPRVWSMLWRSIAYAGLASLIATVLGCLAAFQTSRWKLSVRLIPVVLLTLPAYIYVLAWNSSRYMLERLLRASWTPSSTGFLLAVLVQALYLLPLPYLISVFAIETVDKKLVEAARGYLPAGEVLRRVVLPLMMPFILTALNLGLFLGLLDYSLPYLYGLNVYALEIFASFSVEGDFLHAFSLTIPLVLLCGALLVSSVLRLRKIPYRRGGSSAIGQLFEGLPKPWQAISNMSRVLLYGQAFVLLLAILIQVGSWGRFAASVQDSSQDGVYSGLLALTAAVLALVPAWLLRSSEWRSWHWVLVLLPLAVPPSLMSVAVLSFWNPLVAQGNLMAELLPVLVLLGRFGSFAIVLVHLAASQIDIKLLQAAQQFQTSGIRRFLRVDLALMRAGLLASLCLVFVLGLGELPGTLLVLPPGRMTVALRIFNFLHYGSGQDVAGLSLLLLAITFVFGFVLFTVLGKKDGGFKCFR